MYILYTGLEFFTFMNIGEKFEYLSIFFAVCVPVKENHSLFVLVTIIAESESERKLQLLSGH